MNSKKIPSLLGIFFARITASQLLYIILIDWLIYKNDLGGQMKSLILGMAIIATAAFNNVHAKQDTTPNPRVVSQEDQRTVGDQSNKPVDVEVTRQIRQELMKDDALSTKAKNIKIIVADNGVTLKGTVNNNAEMEKILKHAYVTAPKHKIYNQISVVK
jgi:hypothetical protein